MSKIQMLELRKSIQVIDAGVVNFRMAEIQHSKSIQANEVRQGVSRDWRLAQVEIIEIWKAPELFDVGIFDVCSVNLQTCQRRQTNQSRKCSRFERATGKAQCFEPSEPAKIIEV